MAGPDPGPPPPRAHRPAELAGPGPDHGFVGTSYCVRRCVHRLEQTHDLPFRRLECDPGDEAQVDFGTAAPVVGPDGKRRKTHVLRLVLNPSPKASSETVSRQTTDGSLRCLEGVFRHFGGVPRRLVLDNLKAAVKKADGFDPEINPKVRSFGEHAGTGFLSTRPDTPRPHPRGRSSGGSITSRRTP